MCVCVWHNSPEGVYVNKLIVMDGGNNQVNIITRLTIMSSNRIESNRVEMKWIPHADKREMYIIDSTDATQSTFIFYQADCWSRCFKYIVRVPQTISQVERIEWYQFTKFCVMFVYTTSNPFIVSSFILLHLKSNSQSCQHLLITITFFL